MTFGRGRMRATEQLCFRVQPAILPGGFGEARTKRYPFKCLKRFNGPVAQPDRAAVS